MTSLYVSTPADMLANAVNNHRLRLAAEKAGVRIFDVDVKLNSEVVAPRETIEAHKEFYENFEARYGYRTTAVEDVPLEDLVDAMMSYKANTDWRAFRKSHWEAAMRHIGFNVRA